LTFMNGAGESTILRIPWRARDSGAAVCEEVEPFGETSG